MANSTELLSRLASCYTGEFNPIVYFQLHPDLALRLPAWVCDQRLCLFERNVLMATEVYGVQAVRKVADAEELFPEAFCQVRALMV